MQRCFNLISLASSSLDEVVEFWGTRSIRGSPRNAALSVSPSFNSISWNAILKAEDSSSKMSPFLLSFLIHHPSYIFWLLRIGFFLWVRIRLLWRIQALIAHSSRPNPIGWIGIGIFLALFEGFWLGSSHDYLKVCNVSVHFGVPFDLFIFHWPSSLDSFSLVYDYTDLLVSVCVNRVTTTVEANPRALLLSRLMRASRCCVCEHLNDVGVWNLLFHKWRAQYSCH